MPLHSDRLIEDHARLVIWEIDESVDWFLSQLHLDDVEMEKYSGFRTDQRRVHWLAYRHVLKNIMMKGDHIRIRYDKHSKPFIDLSDDQISVSHSGKYACVIISKRYRVGIDIEQVHKRLHKVADKFVSEEETGDHVTSLETVKLCLYWCTKEALYKLYGVRNLDFRKHIRVQALPLDLHGEFMASIQKGAQKQHYYPFADIIDDYCMVYVIDTPAN